MRTFACVACGKRTHNAARRCDACSLEPHARGNRYEPIRQAVAERDRWICQLCGEPIERDVPRDHPRALNIHCSTPRAHGGSDTDMTNLQASHGRCNREKGSTLS